MTDKPKIVRSKQLKKECVRCPNMKKDGSCRVYRSAYLCDGVQTLEHIAKIYKDIEYYSKFGDCERFRREFKQIEKEFLDRGGDKL